MRLRCLIVDDSEEFLASAARLLESQGIEVVGVVTGSGDALRLARELEPDIVLVDVDLGEEDGIAVARELREYVPRVILISAHSLDDLELLEDDADVAFLPKADLGARAIAALL